MSDDRLFASNNAVSRKWYFINMIVLAIIAYATHMAFDNYVIPNARTDIYVDIANGIRYFIYGIYIVTFFSLIDRRLFDVFGARDKKGYANTTAVLKLAVFIQLFVIVGPFFNWNPPVSYDVLQNVAWIFDAIFVLITFFIGFISGKISNLTYEEYKKKLKYE